MLPLTTPVPGRRDKRKTSFPSKFAIDTNLPPDYYIAPFEYGLDGLYRGLITDIDDSELNMSIAILGKKIGMTQFFDEDGRRLPVTVIQAGPCQVIKVKTAEGRDGYDAVVLGLGNKKEYKISKPVLGQYKKAGLTVWPTTVKEIRVTQDEALMFPEGGTVDVSMFQAGEKVDVTGTSKGHGFAGVMKRHGFHGSLRSHGRAHECHRHGGSIGMCQFPGRVIKGKKMAGHYGVDTHTMLNLKVVAVFPEQNLIMVRGPVAGATNGQVILRKATKVRKRKAL